LSVGGAVAVLPIVVDFAGTRDGGRKIAVVDQSRAALKR
jgi:hypothetical protein